MSSENVEIVRRATAAYNAGAIADSMSLMDPDIEWDMSRVPVPDPGVYRGFAELRDFFSAWGESWQSQDLEQQELIDAGDRVIALVRQVGRGRLSGVEVEQSFAQLWTVRDGKIVRMEMYPDRESALAAVGRG